MFFLPRRELARLLRSLARDDCLQLVDVLSNGLAKLYHDEKKDAAERSIIQPMRTIITNRRGDRNIFMPSSNGRVSAAKIISRPGTGGDLDGILYVFGSDGCPVGLLSAGEFTALRTALVSMAMFVRSPLPRSHVVIFGAGLVAAWHARLAVLLFPNEIQNLVFASRSKRGLDRLASETFDDLRLASPQLRIQVISQESDPDYASQLQRALSQSDVVFGCASSTSPLFSCSSLRPPGDHTRPKSRFISLVGSCKPHMHEVDTDTLLSGGGVVYVDSKEACLEEAGEIIRAGVTVGQLREMGDVFGEEKANREVLAVADGLNLVSKSVGVGYMDLVVGEKVLQIAASNGIGLHMDGF